MAKSKITPAADLLIPSIEVIRNNLLTYFVLSVIPLLLTTFGTANAKTVADFFSPVMFLGVLLSMLFFAPLSYTQTKTAQGKETSLGQAFSKGYHYFWRLLGLSIVFGVMLTIGFFLFIIPGIIVLRRYFLSFYYLIDKDLDIKTAMRKSAASSVKNSWAIYGVLGVGLLFGLFGLIPGIGTIIGVILQFLYSVAPALRYHEMKKL